MNSKITENNLIEQFIEVDDFCKYFEPYMDHRSIEKGGIKKRKRKGNMSKSEIMTILILYHQSGYKCFQYYYEELVLPNWGSYFPKLVSYERFVSLIGQSYIFLYVFVKYRTLWSLKSGHYYIDSKKLPVCDNRRIGSNKVFKDIGQRGKSSCGWFYGLKLHLVINNLGDIINFEVTPANIADNDKKLLRWLLKGVKGSCYGDKGYITSIFEELLENGVALITKLKKNMKQKLLHLQHKMMLLRRGVIESVNDILMTVFDIDHTRHRNPVNAVTHLFAGLAAYSFFTHKPKVIIQNFYDSYP